MAEGLDKQKDVGAVVHALRILQHLAAAPGPQGVAAVARATGISPSLLWYIADDGPGSFRELPRER